MSWMRVMFGSPDWQPVEHLMMWGEPIAFPAPCSCDDRSLLSRDAHTDPACPYVDPDAWYAAEVERMRERAPA